ncbi:MAG: hypothetical protein D8M59_09905 [Planctomycetes bacterium]|nr:hypothetical protein [Planctomycetota bacterium]
MKDTIRQAALLWATVVAVAAATPAGACPSQSRPRQMQQRQQQRAQAPRVGDEAPMFTLKSIDGKSETDTRSFRGQRPLVLFFGSYT